MNKRVIVLVLVSGTLASRWRLRGPARSWVALHRLASAPTRPRREPLLQRRFKCAAVRRFFVSSFAELIASPSRRRKARRRSPSSVASVGLPPCFGSTGARTAGG